MTDQSNPTGSGNQSVKKPPSLSEDIDDTDQMLEILNNIADRLENSLSKREAKGRTITLKIKYFDFQSKQMGECFLAGFVY